MLERVREHHAAGAPRGESMGEDVERECGEEQGGGGDECDEAPGASSREGPRRGDEPELEREAEREAPRLIDVHPQMRRVCVPRLRGQKNRRDIERWTERDQACDCTEGDQDRPLS